MKICGNLWQNILVAAEGRDGIICGNLWQKKIKMRIAGLLWIKMKREVSFNCIFSSHHQLIQRLRQIGFKIDVEPTGAFYILTNAKSFGVDDSFRFCLEVLEKTGVAVTPGIDFGENTEGYIRFSYANSLENIAEGMDKLDRYLKNH